MKHTSTGTYNGTSNGPVTWQFDWTVPDPAVGTITFYAAGNAANGNGSTSGDYIYSVSKLHSEGSLAVPLLSPIGLASLLAMIIMLGMIVIVRRTPASVK